MKEHSQLVDRYKKYRQINRRLNNTLTHRISRKAIRVCGQKLGIMSGDTFVFENEQEMDVLMDYCIYDYYENGKNVVSRYMAESPPVLGSDEYIVLEAMTVAFYALVQVGQVLEGVGVWANDLLSDRRYPIIDMGLGKSAVEGLIIATRLLPFEDFTMTSGAALPVDSDTAEEIFDYINQHFAGEDGKYINIDMQQRADLMTTIIRLCLQNELSSNIEYQGAEVISVAQPLRMETRIGRNEPCPCGSGRKYKRCCGR